jgi:ParB family chromosome partitioning protein
VKPTHNAPIQMIAVDMIRIANPRARNRAKFAEIQNNIGAIGLKRPITVRPRPDFKGEYDLVCGQGRYEACVALNQTHVAARVVDVSAEDAHVMSLVENIARVPRGSLDMAKRVVALQERGHTPVQIAKKVGFSETYTRALLQLFAQGEDRLVTAVLNGELPIGVATEIAKAEDKDLQRCLTEAYERKELRGRALKRARDLIEARSSGGKRVRGKGPRTKTKRSRALSADELVRNYKKETQRQELTVKKARVCEHQLVFLTGALRDLLKDETFVEMLRAESLDKMPESLAIRLRSGSMP